MENKVLITNRDKIREHWNKSESQINTEIDMIKTWLKTQPHLPETPSDNMIEYFLINCKFSIEKTKSLIDMYYTVKDLLPEIYQNKHPSLDYMKDTFKIAYLCPLPNLTEGLYRINFFKYMDENPDLFIAENLTAQVFRNSFEIKINEDLALGEIFIIDFTYLKMGHVVKTTPMLVKKSAFIMEKVWANRIKELHFINSPSYVDTILTLIRTFFSKKLKERIFVHEKIEDLYKFVPQESLPADYGGKQKSLDEISDMWKNKLEEYAPRFYKMEELKVNESLRPEKLKNDDILGYHGNFKKINVD